jgi:hypothetical protein
MWTLIDDAVVIIGLTLFLLWFVALPILGLLYSIGILR